MRCQKGDLAVIDQHGELTPACRCLIGYTFVCHVGEFDGEWCWIFPEPIAACTHWQALGIDLVQGVADRKCKPIRGLLTGVTDERKVPALV